MDHRKFKAAARYFIIEAQEEDQIAWPARKPNPREETVRKGRC